MARPTKPYRLWKTKTGVYYYKLPGMRNWKSTGCKRKTAAHKIAIKKLGTWRGSDTPPVTGSFRQYLEPFYKWDSCPHVARLLSEKHPIGKEHVKHCRSLIDRYILKDPIADIQVRGIRRGHILDFRQRLLIQGESDSKVNRIIGVLKTAIKEGVYRQEIPADPTLGIGNIRTEKKERGVFTRKELKELFPADGLGPWKDLQSNVTFLLAVTTGLRRGEILALCWKDIDFDNRVVNVRQAWINDTTLGLPKWGKVREGIPIPEVTVKRLRELRAESLHVLPDALVFHNTDGSRLSFRWWQNQFREAMKKAKIDTRSRRLTAHSLRHSLATLYADSGISAEKIRAALGWSDDKVRAGYTHLGAEHLRSQADLIDGLFS